MDVGVGDMLLGRGRAPPFTSYATLKAFLEDLKVRGIPQRITHDAMPTVSSSVRKHVLSALRYLALVDEGDRPNTNLHKLVGALGTGAWQAALEATLMGAYPSVFALDLTTVSQDRLYETFYPLANSEDIRRKSLGFFAAAAQDAGLPINARALGKMWRAAGAGDSRGRSDGYHDAPATALPIAGAGAQPHAEESGSPAVKDDDRPVNKYAAAFDTLSECWDPDDMSSEVDQAFVSVLRHLRLKAAGKPTAPGGTGKGTIPGTG